MGKPFYSKDVEKSIIKFTNFLLISEIFENIS
jgi:hypothetical protein